MKAVMAFSQGNTKEINRLLARNMRRLKKYDDDTVDEEIENEGKLFTCDLKTLKIHLENKYAGLAGFEELMHHIEFL